MGLGLIVFTPDARAESGADLSRAATAILEQNCYSCHDGQNHPLDALDTEQLVAERANGRDRFIEPGDPKRSYLWALVQTDVMPKDRDPLTAQEKQTLKDWILAGAVFPDYAEVERPFISEAEVLSAIETHLSKTRLDDRQFIRYFSLHTLANNRKLPAEKIRLAGAALAKSLNSLSRQRSLLVIEPIDSQKVIYAINVRDLGWDQDNFAKWKSLLTAYPYGTQPGRRGDAQRSFDNIKSLFETRDFFDGIAYIRGDWFISQAMRPPLYHDLLDIPNTLKDLESKEGFDRQRDYLRNQIVRGGVLLSGVSTQSRVIDYHQAERGVWMSFDFFKEPTQDPERGDIVRFPLGPDFPENPHKKATFEHAGGEVIFTLPNGLHGYMLVDGEGDRINAGPIDIVFDPSFVSGSPEIVNGVSCVSCHRHGMVEFNDQISLGHAQSGASEIAKIDAIYRPQELQQRLEEERADYLRALRRVIGPILQVGDDVDKPIESFPEPITAITKLYQRDLDADQIAAELGLNDPNDLNGMIRIQPKLISLGLGILPGGGAIKRSHWEARGSNNRESIFQRAALEFGFTPVARLSVQ